MTAQAANSRTARRWQAVRQLSSRTSLRTKLVTAVLALVAVALAVMGFVAIAVFGGYLQDQVDGQVRNLHAQVQAHLLADPFFFSRRHQDMFVLNNNIVEVLDSSGQPVPELGNWQNLTANSGPDVPAADTGPNGTSSQPVTIPALSGGTDWRVITQPVNYSTDGGITNQSGTLVVGVNLGNLKQTMAYLTKLDLSVSVLILIVLAMIGFAVVRANLRALVEIEETAGEIAAGHLNRRVPERDPRTEIGSLGRSLNIMLSQIETAFHAREQSEAAAHQSEERMRRFIADASHELRTPLTAIRGFAEYYRQRGGLVRRWDRDHAADAGAGAAGGGGRAGRPGSHLTTWTGSCSGWRRKRPGWGCSSRTCCCWPGSTSNGRWPGSRSTCSCWPPTRCTTRGCWRRPGPSTCRCSPGPRSWWSATRRGCGR